MWLVNLLPEWMYHFLVFVGVTGVVASIALSYMPVISKYNVPLKLVAVLVLSLGVFLEGASFAAADLRKKVAELELRVAVAEEKAKNVNERIVVEYKTKVVKVKEKSDEIIRYVDRYITQTVDNSYSVPNALVVLHDSAAKNELPPSTPGAYEGTSDIKISEVGKTIAENYESCHEVRQQVKSWQQWYKEQKNIFDKAVK